MVPGPGYDLGMQIRRGVVEDAAVLADLARTTFYDAFAATNDPADMALHLQRAYGVPQQLAELQDPAITTLLAEQDGIAIAYAQIRDHHVPECVTTGAPIELWRFYVERGWHGRGVAAALMECVKSEARLRGARTLWLGVWEHNTRARAFYAKCGFADVGEHIFLFGTDPQTDRVMTTML
jgi:GNAT superfamily N-acetyltransferase